MPWFVLWFYILNDGNYSSKYKSIQGPICAGPRRHIGEAGVPCGTVQTVHVFTESMHPASEEREGISQAPPGTQMALKQCHLRRIYWEKPMAKAKVWVRRWVLRRRWAWSWWQKSRERELYRTNLFESHLSLRDMASSGLPLREKTREIGVLTFFPPAPGASSSANPTVSERTWTAMYVVHSALLLGQRAGGGWEGGLQGQMEISGIGNGNNRCLRISLKKIGLVFLNWFQTEEERGLET